MRSEKDEILDSFLDHYFFLRQAGWRETDAPFNMIHPEYEGVYSVAEAYEIETDKIEFN